MDNNRNIVFGASGVVLIFLFLMRHVWRRKHEHPEPPHVPSLIFLPWLEHYYGLASRRMQYFVDIGLKWRKPIVTIPLPGCHIYVVSSVKIVPSIERQPRVLSARFFFAQFIPRMVGTSRHSLDSFAANISSNAPSKGKSMLLEGVRVTKRILNSPIGSKMNLDAANIVSRHFNDLSHSNEELSLDLWDWVKHEIIVVISESMYGKNNPFWDPKITAAFWKFVEASVWLSLTSLFPHWVVSRFTEGLQARETLAEALDNYFTTQSHNNGSPIVNAHYSIFARHVEHADIPRFECASALGSFSNTAPTTFWSIYHIFSDPALLRKIRDQIVSITTTNVSADGEKITHTVDLKKLREMTVLFSCVEEVSRYRATSIGVRMVLEDTTVGDGEDLYHLRKGGVVVIANQAMHSDKSIWGENANAFVADRFKDKVPHLAFRGFGNGATACCGKKFALHQISSFVAILVMRYDVSPVDGVWFDPGQDGRDTAAQVAPPIKGLKVKMTPREDMKKVSWVFSI